MSESATTAAGALPAKLPFWKHPKLELWVIWWSMPVFYNIFYIGLFVLAKTQPPPPASLNVPQVIAWLNTHPNGVAIGDFMWILTIGLTSWHIGLITTLLQRMSVTKALSYAYLGVLSAASLPGGLLFTYGYSLIALRPERAAVTTEFLYDYGNLTFMGSMGVFFSGCLMLVISILLDKNMTLPKWFGYACIWNLTTEFTVAPVWFFRTGELAWDGSVTFNFNMVIYGVWQFMYIYVFYQAIRYWPPRTKSEIPHVVSLAP